jgi:hypothetical protein
MEPLFPKTPQLTPSEMRDAQQARQAQQMYPAQIPAQYAARESNRKYPALRFWAVFNGIAGGAAMVIGGLCLVAAMLPSSGEAAIAGLLLILGGFALIASGQLFRVLMDIEENTRVAAVLAAKERQ